MYAFKPTNNSNDRFNLDLEVETEVEDDRQRVVVACSELLRGNGTGVREERERKDGEEDAVKARLLHCW